MSTHVDGFTPPDEKWEKMKAIWNSCEDAGVKIPDEVLDFFDGESPNGKPGQETSLEGCAKEWSDGDSRQGYEIEVDKIPEKVKFIRVYNSY